MLTAQVPIDTYSPGVMPGGGADPLTAFGVLDSLSISMLFWAFCLRLKTATVLVVSAVVIVVSHYMIPKIDEVQESFNILLYLLREWAGSTGRVIDVLKVFGRTPLVFYLAHLWLLSLLGLFFRAGASYWVTYGGWMLVVSLLYPVCRRYARFRDDKPGNSLWRAIWKRISERWLAYLPLLKGPQSSSVRKARRQAAKPRRSCMLHMARRSVEF